MKILDYEGLKQVVSKIKGLIDKKADEAEFTRLSESFKFIDTRDTNESPIYYIKNKPKQLVKEFKNLKSIGVNSSSDYCLLITMYPWQDSSAGYPVQIVSILKSDEVYIRRGISDTAWGRWRRILDDTDLKTKLSQLSQDSTHRLVTDAEKTKWNNKAEKSYVDSSIASVNKEINSIENRIASSLETRLKQLESALYEDITGNPFTITFNDINGLSLTNGIFNQSKARIEC